VIEKFQGTRAEPSDRSGSPVAGVTVSGAPKDVLCGHVCGGHGWPTERVMTMEVLSPHPAGNYRALVSDAV
jgi:hypothetical protein